MLTAVLRSAARLATGSTYVLLGADAVKSPGPRADMAASTLAMMRRVLPLPADDELVVRGNAAIQTVAGAVLMTGKAQKLAGVALVASLVPTTLAGHDFWNIQDPMARKMQRTQFIKNTAMLGGLLFAICADDR